MSAQPGYKIIGHLESSYSKVSQATPVKRNRLTKKQARKIIRSLAGDDSTAWHNFKLVDSQIGWVPVCVCGDACTRYHSESIWSIRAALRYLRETPECKPNHWWWVKHTYGWAPFHSSIEPCHDLHRIPRALEKVFDGWEGKIPPDQPQSEKHFSLAELRESIGRWLPQAQSADSNAKDELVNEFLTRIVDGKKLHLPYWTRFEIDQNGRLYRNAKNRLAAYLYRTVRNFGISAARNAKTEEEFKETPANAAPAIEETLLAHGRAERRAEIADMILNKLSKLSGKSPETIDELIADREIRDIKTLAKELGIERTRLYREVVKPARNAASSFNTRS